MLFQLQKMERFLTSRAIESSLTLLLFMAGVSTCRAGAVTYTYTGNALSNITGACPQPCALRGSFTFSSPLTPSYGGPSMAVTPASWSMTDGTVTLSSSASSFLQFNVSATDSSGLPTAWGVTACVNSTCPTASNMSTQSNAPSLANDTSNQQGHAPPYYAATGANDQGSWAAANSGGSSVVTLAASGTLTDGATLGGTITVDQASGQVTVSSLTVSAPDLVNASTIDFDNTITQGNTTLWYLGAKGAALYPDLFLAFPVSTLVGYAGGPLCGLSMLCGGNSASYLLTSLGQGPILQSGSFSLVSSAGLTSQTITFGGLPNMGLGAAPFTLSATASSGLAITFASTTPSVCTVSGKTVSIVGTGICSITATQTGNANFAPATSVTQTFSVTAGGASTYTYTGNPFTQVSGVYTTSDFLSGSFTASMPLAANLSNATIVPLITTFAFSDGVFTWSPANSYVNTAIFSTDASGNITNWTLGLQGAAAPFVTCNGSCFGYLQTTNELPGSNSTSGNDLTGNFGQGNGSNGFPNGPADPGVWRAQVSSASCYIALSPSSQLIPFPAGPGTIGVVTDPACSWNAASDSPFLAITSGSTGTGPGTVTFSATANTSPSTRTGAITIGGQTATINQSGTAPILLLSPSSTTIQWTQGSPAPPPVPLSIYTQAATLAYSTSVSSGTNWLSVSPASGNAPATVLVSINPGSLAPGTYPGTVTVTAAAANPPSQAFTVSLTVIAASAPTLSVSTKSLTYSFAQGSQGQQQTIPVANVGGGTLSFQASATTSSGGNWLSVTQDGSGATLVTPDLLTVTVNPGALAVGTYTGLITITANATVTIPVTLVISAVQHPIALTENALTFTAVAGGGAVPSQTFGIANAGAGVMDWSASSAVTDTGNWLSAGPASGNTDAGSQTVPLVTVSVNPASLTVGQYSGQAKVQSASANNSPEYVSVILNRLPAGSNPGAVVLPSGLIFTQAVGGAAPGSQTITVSNLTGVKLTFATQAETSDGANWLSVTPASGNATPALATTVTVSVGGTGLAAGTRQGIVTLFFEDGSVRTVNVVYVLASGGVTSQRTGPSHPVPQLSTGSCTPTKLLPLLTSLGAQFTVPAAWPNTLEAQVVDDCGNPQVSGTVVASFTNGDPPVQLISLKNGSWTGTWQITNHAVSSIAVTINADNPSLGISGQISVPGNLQNSVNAPVIAAGGVFNAASYAPSAPLAPGAMIAIFGSNLANGATPVNSFPLPEQLSGTLVTIGGEPAPLLYAGSGQINAIVPFGLPVNTNTQVIVRQGNAYTAPMAVTLAGANPAIFTTSGSGTGQGIIIRPDGNYAQPGTPAQTGDELLIYAVGLGVTNPQATDAAPSTASPLLYAAGTATLTIGGQPARVDFAGLAPGFAGLYQVNAAVPAGVHGDTLPVVLSIGAQPGPPVTMAVQ